MKYYKKFLISSLILSIQFSYLDGMSRKRKREETQSSIPMLNELLKMQILHIKNLQNIKDLIEQGADINYLDKNRNSILNILTNKVDDEKIIEFLLSIENINIDNQNNAGNTPLLNVCRIKPNLKMIELLLFNRADVNLTNNHKFTPLIEACDSKFSFSSLKAAKLLVSFDADVNRQTYQGRTALMYAAKMGNLRLALFLLKSGADVSLTDFKGLNCFSFARNSKVREAIREACIAHDKNKYEMVYKNTPLPKELINIVFEYC